MQQPSSEVTAAPDITSAIVEFCRQHTKKTIGIMVFGSYARGEQTALSDVDVIIIDDADRKGRRIQQVVYGYPIQATIVCTDRLSELLQQSRLNGNYFYPNSLANAQILLDSKGICHYLQLKAKKIQTEQPPKTPVSLLELGRITLSNLLNDGSRLKYCGEHWAEQLQWACRVVMMCHEHLLSSAPLWVCQNTALRRQQMLTHFAFVYKQLNQSLESFSQHRCCRTFAKEVKLQMSDYLHFDWDSTGPEHCQLS